MNHNESGDKSATVIFDAHNYIYEHDHRRVLKLWCRAEHITSPHTEAYLLYTFKQQLLHSAELNKPIMCTLSRTDLCMCQVKTITQCLRIMVGV